MMRKIMIEIFLNDLLVNCSYENKAPYVENKRKEWIFLRQALKTKSVTPISDRQFFYIFNCAKVVIFSIQNFYFGNFNITYVGAKHFSPPTVNRGSIKIPTETTRCHSPAD
jgi:hypothetical protein